MHVNQSIEKSILYLYLNKLCLDNMVLEFYFY